MRMTIFYGIATASLGAALAIVSARTLKPLPPRTIRELARKLSRPAAFQAAQWRKRFMPVVRCAAPLAGQPVAMAIEPRR
jgi:hypothetical protein